MKPTKEEVRKRRQQAQALIDQILKVPPGGTPHPEAESLRKYVARYPGQPDRALMEHTREQMKAAGLPFDGVLPEDLPD